jgi:hypothetical protein
LANYSNWGGGVECSHGAWSGLTIGDFERLPDALAHYHELVDGELIDVSGNILEHNELRTYL